MATSVRLSQTYLFKINALKNMMDRAFDHVLQTYAYMTLSQFMLLLVVSEHPSTNQRAVARLLEVSPAAINRQVDIALRLDLLYLKGNPKGRGRALSLTAKGELAIEQGVTVLEKHLFHIFKDEDCETSLMAHLDLLLDHTKGIIIEQASEIGLHKMQRHLVSTEV